MDKVIVLEGNLFECKRILDGIRSSFTSDFDTTIFDSKDHYNYVSQAVTEVSCFAENKLFIMEEMPDIEAPTKAQARTKLFNRLKKLFPSIPAGNVLVFNNVGISAASFLKEVKKFGKVYKFDQKISKIEGKKIINNYFKDKSIILDVEISQLLIDSLNLNGDDVDVDQLNLMILKFHHYIGDKKNVTEKDVRDVCSSSKEFIIWSLYHVLDDISSSKKKEIGPAIGLLNKFLSEAKYFEHETVMTLKSMIWRYGLLLLAKNGVNDEKSHKDIREEISNIKKLESKGKGFRITMNKKLSKDMPMQEYSVKMINSVMNSYHGKASLSCYNYNQLLLIYYTLIKSLIKIRSGCTESEIRIAISMVVSVICGEITKKNTIDGILEHSKITYGIFK